MSDLLEIAETYLQTSVAPLAQDIDRDPEALRQAWNGLGELGVLTLRVPRKLGGPEVTADVFAGYQECIARHSGALAFLQTQHQSAAGMLSVSSNSALQRQYLPAMGHGKIGVGIGFSQLRRPGKPMVRAVPVEGGYRLDGTVPWVTGWGIFEAFIAAATLPDGRAVFGVVPFRETEENGGAIAIGAPMSLCAMTSTNTVAVTLKDWFLSGDRVVSVQPVGWIEENDKKKVLQASFFALGCARAGLDIVETAFEKRGFPFIREAAESLGEELRNCRAAILDAIIGDEKYGFSEQVKLRARAIALAVRCAHAAVTVSAGAANLSDRPAGRVYREALVFTVSGQTQPLMEATLSEIGGGSGGF